MKLMRADALFAGRHQVDRLKHLVQRNVRALKNRADLDRKLLAAIATFTEAKARFAKIVMLAAHRAAMRANRTLGPKHAFQMLEGFGFIVKVGLRKDGHWLSPLSTGYLIWRGV